MRVVDHKHGTSAVAELQELLCMLNLTLTSDSCQWTHDS